VRAIASALGLSRSNLIERRQRRYFVRRRRSVDDSGLTERIKQIVDARASYHEGRHQGVAEHDG
jgi:hypothetical protein